VQLAAQLLKNGFDNFAEREQQQLARPHGGNIHARLRRIVPIDRGATPSHCLAENAPRIRHSVTLTYLKVRAMSRSGSP